MLIRPDPSQEAVPVWFVTKENWPKLRATLSEPAQVFASACNFEPKPGRTQILPGAGGEIAGILFGIEGPGARARDLFLPGQLAAVLPPGVYRFANQPHDAPLAALSWLLRILPLSPLQERWRRFPAALCPGGRRCRPDRAHRARCHAGARSHQHARQ